MHKRYLSILILIALLLQVFSCLAETKLTKHSQSFFDAFDTVITFISYTDSDNEYDRQFELVQSEMTRYHQIFDQYHLYDGVNNLCCLNQKAGIAPVYAEPELIDLLLKVKNWRNEYTGQVNPALGAVLALWHETRENTGIVPSQEALSEAAKHCNYDDVIINREDNTVFFSDPLLKLDLGAVAKGYAAQCVADKLQAEGITHFILNAGGNVICADAPSDGRTAWTIAIEDIDGASVRKKIYTVNRSIVTSGDYQRYITIDGVRYHHLIDPDTLYPASYCHAVTVICTDSALADFLSTAAFLMPCEDGIKLIESIDQCEAFWVLPDDSEKMTSGFNAYFTKPQ